MSLIGLLEHQTHLVDSSYKVMIQGSSCGSFCLELEYGRAKSSSCITLAVLSVAPRQLVIVFFYQLLHIHACHEMLMEHSEPARLKKYQLCA